MGKGSLYQKELDVGWYVYTNIRTFNLYNEKYYETSSINGERCGKAAMSIGELCRMERKGSCIDSRRKG